MSRWYLTTSSSIDAPMLNMLPRFHVDDDTLDPSISADGWRFAEYWTGELLFVRSKGNKRFLKAWNAYVTDFEVREVDTSTKPIGDGRTAIVATLGKPLKRPMFTRSDAHFA